MGERIGAGTGTGTGTGEELLSGPVLTAVVEELSLVGLYDCY
jgi:hypothetical protein